MARRRDIVSVRVDKNYFDSVFEPERKRLQNKLGVNFTQPKFTAYLARSGARIKYPKRNKKFYPKRPSNGGLDFRSL